MEDDVGGGVDAVLYVDGDAVGGEAEVGEEADEGAGGGGGPGPGVKGGARQVRRPGSRTKAGEYLRWTLHWSAAGVRALKSKTHQVLVLLAPHSCPAVSLQKAAPRTVRAVSSRKTPLVGSTAATRGRERTSTLPSAPSPPARTKVRPSSATSTSAVAG